MAHRQRGCVGHEEVNDVRMSKPVRVTTMSPEPLATPLQTLVDGGRLQVKEELRLRRRGKSVSHCECLVKWLAYGKIGDPTRP